MQVIPAVFHCGHARGWTLNRAGVALLSLVSVPLKMVSTVTKMSEEATAGPLRGQTASHSLKLLLDAVFGPDRFRSEIIWKGTTSRNDARRNLAVATDCIFCYGKTDAAPFHAQYLPHDPKYVADKYRFPLTPRICVVLR